MVCKMGSHGTIIRDPYQLPKGIPGDPRDPYLPRKMGIPRDPLVASALSLALSARSCSTFCSDWALVLERIPPEDL